MKHTILLIILLASLPDIVTCQEQQPPGIIHLFSYEIGANYLKEENLVPVVHKGPIQLLTYRFEKQGKNYNEITVSLGYSRIKAEPETEKVSQNIQFRFGYCSDFHIVKRAKFNYYLGFNMSYAYSLVEFPVWDESRAYWGSSLTLGVSNRMIFDMKENQKWYFSWDIHPMGLYSRPDEVRLYAQEEWTFSNIIKTTNSNLKLGFVDNILLSYFRTEYRLITKKDRYIALQYSLSYSRIQKANEGPLQDCINSFGISIGF